MPAFNRVVIMGNVTRDPELRYTAGGKPVTDITVAINSRRRDSDNELVEDTTFVNVTLWGRTAEIAAEYLAKGQPVHIEGRLQQDQWEDKETGQKRSKLKVVGTNIQLIGKAPEGKRRSQSGEEGEDRYSFASDENAPF